MYKCKIASIIFFSTRYNLDRGLEHGGAIAVYYRGELVVEFSGGYADYDAEWPWNKDTLSQASSTQRFQYNFHFQFQQSKE